MANPSNPFNNKRNNAKRPCPEIALVKPPAETAEPAPQSWLARMLTAALAAPARLALLVSVLVISIAGLVGYVQRIFFPQCVVVVQPFEISPEIAKQLSMSGKAASDVLIDYLNQHSASASQFRGADYYLYDAAGAQTLALKQSIRVPVQSSNDIEVNGISVGTIMKVYSLIRNKQWLINGDILNIGDQTVIRLRLNGDGVAKYWETPKLAGMDGVSLIRKATEQMLADQNPEMLGRSLLQQHRYREAIEIFRRWALDEPRNWKPTYYLSLAYDYNHQTREANAMARWSADVYQRMARLEGRTLASSNTDNPAELAAVTEAVFDMGRLPKEPTKSVDEAKKRLQVLQQDQKKLEDLARDHSSNLNYSLQLARALDREAELELDPLVRPEDAWRDESRAIDLLDKTIEQAPENGGLYEQRSIFLQREVTMAGARGLSGDQVKRLREKETEGFRSALVLSPRNDSPLWGAVYGLLDRQADAEALDLAQAVLLLQPGSPTAEVAYTVALVRSGKTDEAKQHLPLLLDKASQAELEALSHSFENPGESEMRSKIEDAYRRRFAGTNAPHDLGSPNAARESGNGM